MDMVMTLVWYPWTEGQGGPAGTQGAFKTLDLELHDADWPRLPSVGETIFFDDGGSAPIEAVGWKLNGTAYLYLGKRFEKRGEALELWLERGFGERPGQAGDDPPAQPGSESGARPGAEPTVPATLPPMPQPAAQ
jgi:hypothetical protein